jgi:hypothetical protein
MPGPFTVATLNCKGNLGPSQGLTMTLPINNVTGDLGLVLNADPSNVINAGSTPPEFSELNNQLILTVIHF